MIAEVSSKIVELIDTSSDDAYEQRADLLRIRLQLAAYKVRTDQTRTPFFWLRGPRSPPECLGLPVIKGEEGVISAARSRATDQEKRVVRTLNSLPMPTIIPTAYSARYMVPGRGGVSSSPPVSTSSEELATSGVETLTPRDYTRAQRTPVQLSSLTASGIDGVALQRMDSSRDVTNSVGKTEAANGLLDLIRAAAES